MAPSTGTQSPIVKLAIAVGVLLLAAGACVAGLQETRLTCTRAACEVVKTYPDSRTRHDLRDVHAVEVHQGSGKQRNTYTVVIVDSRGVSTRIHSSGEAGAAALKRELEEVLAGQRPRLELVTPPMYWMFAFVAMLAVFSLLEIRAAIRGWGKHAAPAPAPARAPAQRRAIVLWAALLAVTLVVSGVGNCLLRS